MAEYEDFDPGVDGGYGENQDMVSPLQMLMMGQFSTVTPEGKAKATEVFQDLYGKRTAYDEGEQSAYDEYETQARAARDTLRKAREVLAAKKTPTTKYLEMARGFGAPTRAGSFAESISNYADARIPGRQREADWEANRDAQLLQFDQSMSGIDQQLAMNRLKLKQARRAADDRLMIESMKIMGRPVPGAGRAPPKDAPRVAQEALDKAYVKDYVDFITQGASTATGDISALKAANRALKGTRIDPRTGQEVQGKKPTTISGPVIGLLPKVIRDIFTPKGSATQEDIESVAQKSLKTILGNQFTAPEGERFLARVYNPRFEEHVNARRVERLLDQIERAHAEKVRAAKYFQANGTLRGYEGRMSWSMDMFDPDIPEGQSPLDIIQGEISDIQNEPAARPQRVEAPDEGMDEIDIESLLPAGMAKGGKVRTLKSFAKEWQKHLDAGDIQEARRVAKDADDTLGVGSSNRFTDSPVERALNNIADSISQPKPPQKHAEGGVVEGEFPDGRPRFRMPDGKVIKARPGDTYEFALDLYTKATGTAPTRPGLPPQQIPPREEMEGPGQPLARPPMMAAQAEEPPSFGEAALGELPSALAYTAAGAAGAGIGDKVLTRAGDRLIPGRRETPAQRRVLDMMQEQRRSPEMVAANVRSQQRMGIPAMAMDDPALRGTADTVLPETGLQNASTILQRLKDRAGGLEERVTERVNQGLKPDDYFEQLDKMKNDLYSNSKPLYEAAYAANPAVKSKVLPRLLETPDGKKAVKTALRIMRNEGKKIGKQDAMQMVTAPSLEFLDRVKQGMDQLITKEEGHGMDYKATPLGKSMRSLRDALVNELDTATTPAKGESLYKKARAQYAGDLELLDALQAGRDEFSKLQPQQLTKVLAEMSFAEKDAFRTGVAQNLFEALQTPTTDVNSARRVIGSTAMQARLRTLFDSDKQFELFKTALEKEAELHELDKKSIRRGEAGQELHAGPQEDMIKKGSRYVPRLGIGSATMWILQAFRNGQIKTEKQMDQVLEHLKASTPEELADFEKKMGPKYARRLSRKGRAAKTAVAGALAGATYRVATGAEEDDDAEQE